MQSEGNYYWWAPDVAKVEAARFEVVRDEGEMGEKRNWNWVRAKTCELLHQEKTLGYWVLLGATIALYKL